MGTKASPTLIEPPQGGFAWWLCVFSVGDIESPFVPKNYETTKEIDEVLLLASQVLDGLEPEANRSELEAVISDELAIDELLSQASQQPKLSALWFIIRLKSNTTIQLLGNRYLRDQTGI